MVNESNPERNFVLLIKFRTEGLGCATYMMPNVHDCDATKTDFFFRAIYTERPSSTQSLNNDKIPHLVTEEGIPETEDAKDFVRLVYRLRTVSHTICYRSNLNGLLPYI